MYHDYRKYFADVKEVCLTNIRNNDCWIFEFFSPNKKFFIALLLDLTKIYSRKDLDEQDKLSQMISITSQHYCTNKVALEPIINILNNALNIKHAEWQKYYRTRNYYLLQLNQLQMARGRHFITASYLDFSCSIGPDPIESRLKI